MNANDFISPLGPVMARFIALKQALGRRYDSERRILGYLDTFLASKTPDGADLTAATFSDWCQTLAPLCASTRRNRLWIVHQFCRYRRRSEPACFIPDPALFPPINPPRPPYWFTPAELLRLLQAADALTPTPHSPLRPAVMRVSLVLLYTLGLRRSERVSLRLGDLDPLERTLAVQAGKFHKASLLPLSADAFAAVHRYLQVRTAAGFRADSEAPLLCHGRQGALGYGGAGLHQGLSALFQDAGLRSSDGRLPRVHDFRHHFAIQVLRRWYEAGADVQAKLPLLSLYMGHVSIASTAYYLPFVTDLAMRASERFEAYGGALITPQHDQAGGQG